MFWGDGEGSGEEDGKRESEREKGWSGVGVMFGIFGGWGKGPDGRRLTRPRRERERERFKITRHLPERASRSQKARISLFFAFFFYLGFVFCGS